MQSLEFVATTAPAGAPTVVFLHANGYPPGSYRLLLEPLAAQLRLATVEHRPLWDARPPPRVLDWGHYADDLLATLARELPGPVWLMGHSMGAVTGVLAASRAPERVAGLIALDPVLLPEVAWLGARIANLTRSDRLAIVRRALSRPHTFESFETAFAFYRDKRAFQRLSDAALWDYVLAGHTEAQGHGVSLRWSGAWEACVYRSAPLVWRRLRRLQLPMLGIAGRDSDVLPGSIRLRWQRAVPQLELEVLEGGHLIPLEQPEACAARILEFFRHQDALVDADPDARR